MSDIVFHPGKTPARDNAVKFKFADFVDVSALPPVPKGNFGHEAKGSYQMFGNDRLGDCVCAGACNETIGWMLEGKKTPKFVEDNAVSMYKAVAGYDPNDPNSDQGTDMQAAASWRRKTGLVDAAGNVHKVAAYLALEPGNIKQHMQALYLFGAVGIGIEFPASAMTQFNKGLYWSYNSKSPIEGGHYIPLVGKYGPHIDCVTWGKIQSMTTSFFTHFNDESIAYVSFDMLDPATGKSPEGFDAVGLQAALAAL